jgi:16S rRNA (guanine527-N7)-methyltransferase
MNEQEFKLSLKKYSKEMNIQLNDNQAEKLYKFKNILIEWNEKMNLTSITEDEEVIIKHFVDSLTIEKYINKDMYLVDVGTGAGFPAIPIKIVRDDIKIILLDSLNKRITFLNNVIEELDLKNIETIHSRAEEFGRNSKYREKFDIVTSRAVANLATLSEYTIPLVKKDGKCIYMKGSNIEEELSNSKKAIKTLGAKIENIEELELPNNSGKRNIVILNKVNNTPNKYPRKAGIPAKQPLI